MLRFHVVLLKATKIPSFRRSLYPRNPGTFAFAKKQAFGLSAGSTEYHCPYLFLYLGPDYILVRDQSGNCYYVRCPGGSAAAQAWRHKRYGAVIEAWEM